MMKKIYILIILTIGLMASPMPQDEALSLFKEIKDKEYNWVLAQWSKEMTIKTQSRSSTRKSVWGHTGYQEQLTKKQTHDPLRVIPNQQSTKTPPVDPITVPDI